MQEQEESQVEWGLIFDDIKSNCIIEPTFDFLTSNPNFIITTTSAGTPLLTRGT